MKKVHAKVTLLSWTRDAEKLVETAARTCYSEKTPTELYDAAQGDSKFIENVLGMGHMSVMEHASFTFAIEGVSRAFLAQITRHRLASYSVQSQRYVNMEDFDYVVPPSVVELGREAIDDFEDTMGKIRKEYVSFLKGLGPDKEEDARFLLPNAGATNMVVTMNARELLHFFEMRCCKRAQWEIRDVAWQMLKQVYAVAPSLFKRAGAPCCHGECPEGKKSCGKAAEQRAKFDAVIGKDGA